MKRTKSSSLLFEIGVEEIPSSYLVPAEASIRSKAPGLLSECGWQFDQLNVYSTPRRFVIHATNFRPLIFQEEEKLGPLKDQAYQDGRPTPALLGFLKSVNRKESDVFFKDSQRGSRVCVKVKKEKKPLRHFFEALPTCIEFPKLMRWERSRYSFARPIRWAFAYVDHKLETFKIADVVSGSHSFGHRFLAPTKLNVSSADFKIFSNLLLKHHVVLDARVRVARIRSFLKRVHNHDEELVQTVANLVEDPYPVQGVFAKKYLNLPVSVLETCMRKHQRIFACYDSPGRLTDRFVAVINGRRKDVKRIVGHYENVLTSRLEDAEFFFKEDRKTKLEAKVDRLKEMIFLGSLGSYLEKAKRLVAEVQYLSKEAEVPADVMSRASRSAYLAKADLTTHLVYEFPELQGKAGSEYAQLDGEDTNVAKGIYGHYLPVNLTEDYRELKKRLNFEGALVGLCDRMDLLVGASGLGIELNASQDPYALRRAAGGIVKILRVHPLRFSLANWIRAVRREYGNLFAKSDSDIALQLLPFFKERITYELQVKSGSREFEVLQGIFAAGFDQVIEVYEKFEHLSGEVNNQSFLKACKVMERTTNILKGVKGKVDDRVERALLQDPLEQRLFDLLGQEEASLNQLIRQKHYGAAVKRYGDVFYQPLHDFFDRVLVNVEDSKVRTNRQSLVKKINSLCASRIADLSYISNLQLP